jgi:hypothetical protein
MRNWAMFQPSFGLPPTALQRNRREFGYQAIKLMAQVIKGDRSVIPANKQIIIPTLVMNESNVAEFTKRINELRGRTN